MSSTKPSLYGLTHSNRNFADRYYWGKNQFNSSFPASPACYMKDEGKDAIYIKHNGSRATDLTEIPINLLFGTDLPNHNIHFSFEHSYTPYEKFVHDALRPIDLVLKNAETEEFIRPLEIKLTVLPDDSTSNLTDADYGPELVIRSPTTRYMALSMAESCQNDFDQIRDIFSPVC